MTHRTSNPRQRQLRDIHVAKKQLGMDDDTYRALLQRVTGKTSSADMSGAERQAVIAEMLNLGFELPDSEERRKNYPGRPANVDQVPLLRKVEALLADAGRPWAYAHAMAHHMFGITRVQWLRHNQLHSLVKALQIDANRRAK